MCGIAGIYRSEGVVDRAPLKRAAQMLAHRGPDHQATVQDGALGLVHTRLSIIDLSGGDQPLYTSNNDLTLIANGEVYNYIELREALIAQGAQFATQSDSEVILQGYAQRGPAIVDDLAGMYAFALFDRSQASLYLARDRLGIKPLYYCVHNNQFLFASEIKAILAMLERSPDIDPSALHQYLQNQFSTGRRTPFQGIYRVLPGELLKIPRTLAIEPHQYWDANRIAPRSFTFDEAAKEFDDLFDTVMTQHMRADVPFGLFLSGGTDSGVLAWALTHHYDHPLRTFSVGFQDVSMQDELNDAQLIAKRFGTQHTELKLTSEQIFNRLVHTVWAADDLMRDFASLPTALLAQTAAAELKVVFSGEGGDEIFAGYRRYRSSFEQRLKNLLFPGSGGFRVRGQWHPGLARKVFGDRLKQQGSAMRAPFIEAWARCPADWSNIQCRQYTDLTTALPDNLLVKADRMLMAFGLEGRVPFLDHRLVAFGLSLPDELKIQNRQGKVFLKRWAERYLPPDHLWQKKRGFHVPVGEWLHGEFLQQLGHTLLRNEAIKEWFQPSGIRHLLHRQHHRGDVSRELMAILQFAIWHRLFIEQPGTAPPIDIAPLEWLN